jgi:outer membrane protein assembly factor BamB
VSRYLALACLVCFAPCAAADNWPAWRGPTGQGLCAEKDVPLKWSATENVKWKVPLADQGNSTPVIWGDRIFLTQANKGGTVRSLLCFARGDGKLLWQKDVHYADKERNWNPSWYANASPVTDGKLVVVNFASAGMYCYDVDGKELWKRTDLGKWEHMFGSGSSPVLYEGLAILWCGPNQGKGRNFLLAVDKETGSTMWEHDEKHGSWATPLIVKVKGQDQLLLGMSTDVKGAPDPETGYLKGIDPRTGKVLWYAHGIDSYVYTSALYSNDVAVEMSGYGGAAEAIKLGGTGDITKTRLWRHPKSTQRVGSGVIVDAHIYMVDENSTPHCYELTTGKDLWQGEQRLGGKTWGSLVYADGRLYLLMNDNTTFVMKASPKFELLATNRLTKGEDSNSSIAISDGDIFIRTFKHLWCISAKK